MWRPGQGGLMLFESEAADVSTAREALSRLSVETEAQQCPVEGDKNENHGRFEYSRVEIEDRSYPSSPGTLSASSERSSITLFDFVSEPTPTAPGWDMFGEQLQYYAARAPSSSSTTPESVPSSPETINYETDVTDFLPYTQTPCPKRKQSKPAHLSSHHFEEVVTTNQKVPLVRRLWECKPPKKQAAKRSPQDKTSLDKLREIERKTPRKWSFAERELLCVMYRWFKSEPASLIPDVFRAITGADSTDDAIRTQWDGHCLWYGPKAVEEYAQVFSCSFANPTDQYCRLMQAIERKAEQLGVSLRRRKCDPKFIAGKAARSSRDRVRERYKALCRRSSQVTPSKDPSALESFGLARLSRLGGLPMQFNQQEDEQEVLVDVEDQSTVAVAEEVTTTSPGAQCHSNSLAFRVWDKSSRTTFSSTDGFVANGHSSWNGEYLPPPDPCVEQGSNFLMFVANQHLSMEGGDGSGFVSVSTSLVQVVQKAARMVDPQIALVALDHPSLQGSRKKLYASSILSWLKKHGQAQWARYKGRTETLIWASIPVESIVHYFALSELGALSRNSNNCAELLGLEEFEPNRTVPQVAAKLREKNLPLRADTMGEVARTFGLDGPHVHIDHIKDFVTSLVDGWSLRCNQLDDVHTMSTLSMTFATSLKSQSRTHHLQDVMGAFIDGCRQGHDNIQFYARRRRSVYRRRTG